MIAARDLCVAHRCSSAEEVCATRTSPKSQPRRTTANPFWYETIHHRIRIRPFWARDLVWYMTPNCLQLTLPLAGHAQARVQNPSPRKCLSARSLFAKVQLAKPCVEVVHINRPLTFHDIPSFFGLSQKHFSILFLEPVPVVGQKWFFVLQIL